jgi:hypothetical protein
MTKRSISPFLRVLTSTVTLEEKKKVEPSLYQVARHLVALVAVVVVEEKVEEMCLSTTSLSTRIT